MIAYSSEYFSRLLLSEFKEASQSHVTLKFPDPNNVFPDVLAFMYSGRMYIPHYRGLIISAGISLTLDNVIPLLTMADHYLIKPLEQLCSDFLSSHVSTPTLIAHASLTTIDTKRQCYHNYKECPDVPL